jgi:hypothetical protein
LRPDEASAKQVVGFPMMATKVVEVVDTDIESSLEF